MTYAADTDLLTGSIPLPPYVDKTQWLKSAADEVDSYIGQAYVTPVVLPEPPAEGEDPFRQTRIVLKRVTSQLASGRIILAAAAGSEDTELHAYGASLVRDAISALKVLMTGTPALPGATPIVKDNLETGSLPIMVNHDPYSQVDAFYDFTSPTRTVIDPYRSPYGIIPRGA